MVETPIGFRCRECGLQRLAIYQLSPIQMILGVVVGLGGGFAGGYLGAKIGFFVCFVAPLIGSLIGEGVSRAIQRKHSALIALLTGAGIIAGVLIAPLLDLAPLLKQLPPEEQSMMIRESLFNPWALIFCFLAVPTAYWRLR